MGHTIISGGSRATVPVTGIKASDLAVGSVVKLMENNTPVEYMVVNQGIPQNSNLYDSSCDGTWLLMKDIYEERQWHSSDVNDYENSTMHSYLNNGFLALFDANIQSVIKQVKVPYRKGSGSSKTVTSGENGLNAKIFLLSFTEVNLVNGYDPTNEGACLSYFSDTAQVVGDSKRVANLNGSATPWWLRSPYCNGGRDALDAACVTSNGNWSCGSCSESLGIRPALIISKDSLFDESTLILKGVR